MKYVKHFYILIGNPEGSHCAINKVTDGDLGKGVRYYYSAPGRMRNHGYLMPKNLNKKICVLKFLDFFSWG